MVSVGWALAHLLASMTHGGLKPTLRMRYHGWNCTLNRKMLAAPLSFGLA